MKFSLPAPFVASRVRLEPGELAHGFANGWLDEVSTVGLAEGLVAAGATSAPIEELAGVFRGELWRVQQLADDIETDPDSEPDRVWLYLALAWLHDHKDEYVDPLQMIEMLYSDFGYPTEMEGLVRFMPPPTRRFSWSGSGRRALAGVPATKVERVCDEVLTCTRAPG